jgi:phage-related protein
MLSTVVGAAKNVINGVETFFSELPNKIAYWLGYALGKVIQWGIDLVNWVTTEVPAIIASIVAFFSELPGRVWTWLVDTVNKVTQWGINLHSTASTWVTNTINAVVKFFSELPGKVWTWLVSTVNKVIQWGANLLAAASSAAQNAISKVVEWFQQLPGKVWAWLVNTVNKVTQFSADLKAKAAEAAQGFVDKLVNGVKGLPDKFREIGSNIVSGIWNGISSGWDWLVGKVKGLADSLFQGAKDALGINSPSKVFAQEVGRWIPPGIGVGMEKAMPDLQRLVDTEMEELAGRMQAAVAIETGGITVRTRAKAEHNAETEYPKGGGDTYIDNHIEQENNYHTDVVTKSEVSRAQREAVRNLLGGVKK